MSEATLTMNLTAIKVTQSSAIVDTIDLYSWFWSKNDDKPFSSESVEHSLHSGVTILGNKSNFKNVSLSMAMKAFSNRADVPTASHSPYSPDITFRISLRNSFGMVSTALSSRTILLSVNIMIRPLTSFDCHSNVDFG